MLLNSWSAEVLSRFPAMLRGTLVFLGNHGGFSGALLWRLDAPGGSYCLKAWPVAWRSAQELAWIHGLMARASSLPWMPHALLTSDGASFIVHQGRLWELVTWMPGAADFAQAPSEARLSAACTALAEVHRAWAPANAKRDVCPALVRRWDSWRAWQQLVQSGWRPVWQASDPYAAVAEPLWRVVRKRSEEVPRLLTPWSQTCVPIQPCVCDLWHDHVLFTRDAVTGLIDFGSVKEDHVAVDLARLLGSLIGAEESLWHAGFAAYEKLRPLSASDRELARVLDRTGTILAAANWLRWLYQDGRRYDRPELVASRLAALMRRLQPLAA